MEDNWWGRRNSQRPKPGKVENNGWRNCSQRIGWMSIQETSPTARAWSLLNICHQDSVIAMSLPFFPFPEGGLNIFGYPIPVLSLSKGWVCVWGTSCGLLSPSDGKDHLSPEDALFYMWEKECNDIWWLESLMQTEMASFHQNPFFLLRTCRWVLSPSFP